MARRRGIGTGSRVGQQFRYGQNRERSRLIGEGINSTALDDAWVVRITETRQSTVDRAGNPIPYTHTEMVPEENAVKFRRYKELGSSKAIVDPETGAVLRGSRRTDLVAYILGLIGDGGSYRIGDLKNDFGTSETSKAITLGIMENLIEVHQ